MTLPALVVVSFLPVVVCLLYCAFSGVLSPFSGLFAAVLALAAVALASITQVFFDPALDSLSGLQRSLASAFVESALIEELSKLLAVSLVPGVRSRRLASRQILLGSLVVGLSFSAFETVAYAIRSPLAPWARLVTALPVHAASAVVGGSLIAFFFRAAGEGFGDARERSADGDGSPSDGGMSRPRGGNRYALFALAIVLHGAFNLSMGAGGPFIALGLACVLSLVGMAFALWNRSGEAG